MIYRRLTDAAFLFGCVAGTLMWTLASCAMAAADGKSGKTRIYYVAVDEVNWDYAPSGRDESMGMDFDAVGKGYAVSGPHRLAALIKRQFTANTATPHSPN